MTERLIKELQRIRLTLNAQKTKILRSNPADGDYALNFVHIGDEFVKVLNDTDSHRYLGRLLCTSISDRIQIETRIRQRSTWISFHNFKPVLVDQSLWILTIFETKIVHVFLLIHAKIHYIMKITIYNNNNYHNFKYLLTNFVINLHPI